MEIPRTSGSISSSMVGHKSEEQLLFESKLLEDEFGIALRKIDRFGRAQLRYVRCVPLSNNNNSNSSNKHSSHHSNNNSNTNKFFYRNKSSTAENHFYVSTLDDTQNLIQRKSQQQQHDKLSINRAQYALTWGSGRHCIPLTKFQCVKLGRQTPRTRLSKANHTCLLSLCVKHSYTHSHSMMSKSSLLSSSSAIDKKEYKEEEDWKSVLDMEAPTRLDRDLFAHAFAQFLGEKNYRANEVHLLNI